MYTEFNPVTFFGGKTQTVACQSSQAQEGRKICILYSDKYVINSCKHL
jgi:hypothetical protein